MKRRRLPFIEYISGDVRWEPGKLACNPFESYYYVDERGMLRSKLSPKIKNERGYGR